MAPTAFPGFVDLQVNGFMGVDFSGPDLTADSCAESFEAILASGTVAFLPTLITSSREIYRRNIPLILEVMRRPEFRPHLLGFHLEGPFLCPEPGAIGAHNPDLAAGADAGLLDELYSLCDGELRILTVAAGVEGIEPLIEEAVARGTVVSLGHQLALEDDLARAVEAGAVALTHLGNGLPLSIPRHPNTIFAGLAEDRLWALIITDGHHIPASLIKTVLRSKGVGRTVVTSDASPLAGLSAGTYDSMGTEVVLDPSGRLYDPVKGNLAGSSYSMLQCMNFLAGRDLVTYDELYKLGFTNPLGLIGEDADAERSVKWAETGLGDGRHVAFDGRQFAVQGA